MSKKLSVGKITVLAIIFLILNFLTTGLLALATWIYLILIARKKKTNLFLDQMEPKSKESHLKRLKAFLKVAGISFLIAVVGIITHNVLSGLYEIDEPISFFIAIGTLLVFIIATTGGLVVFLQGLQKLM